MGALWHASRWGWGRSLTKTARSADGSESAAPAAELCCSAERGRSPGRRAGREKGQNARAGSAGVRSAGVRSAPRRLRRGKGAQDRHRNGTQPAAGTAPRLPLESVVLCHTYSYNGGFKCIENVSFSTHR